MQTCEEAVHAQSVYCWERDGRVGMQSTGRTVPHKIKSYSHIYSVSRRSLFEISPPGPRRDKVGLSRRLGVSVHISG